VQGENAKIREKYLLTPKTESGVWACSPGPFGEQAACEFWLGYELAARRNPALVSCGSIAFVGRASWEHPTNSPHQLDLDFSGIFQGQVRMIMADLVSEGPCDAVAEPGCWDHCRVFGFCGLEDRCALSSLF
jgi:hypothetical protein